MLSVLGQATPNFVAVATLLFFFFCECPKFCHLAKQRRKIFLGVSEVGKIDFALYFFWLCVFFLIFHFLLLRSRDDFLTGSNPQQLVEAEQAQRKAVQNEAFAGFTRSASRTLSGEHTSILARSLNAYIWLTIVLFEDHEEGLHRIILLKEDSRRYKRFGPSHPSPSRRVLDAVIRQHQRDRPFSNAWRHMATINSMSSDSVVLDPFRFQETVLMNFLRSQGLLPGRCIRHFPHKVSTSPYSWADVADDDPSCNVPEPVDSKKAEEQLQHKCSKDISEFCISFETPWTTSSDLHRAGPQEAPMRPLQHKCPNLRGDKDDKERQQTITCQKFHPNTGYLFHLMYAYITQGRPDRGLFRLTPRAQAIITQGIGVYAAPLLQPTQITARTAQGNPIYVYHPTAIARLPIPSDTDIIYFTDASSTQQRTPTVGCASVRITRHADGLHVEHHTGATIFGASSHGELRTMADAVTATPPPTTIRPHNIWVVVDATVDIHLTRRLADLPLHKALESGLTTQALGLWMAFKGMHPQDALHIVKQESHRYAYGNGRADTQAKHQNTNHTPGL